MREPPIVVITTTFSGIIGVDSRARAQTASVRIAGEVPVTASNTTRFSVADALDDRDEGMPRLARLGIGRAFEVMSNLGGYRGVVLETSRSCPSG